jgi:hypothetical protein
MLSLGCGLHWDVAILSSDIQVAGWEFRHLNVTMHNFELYQEHRNRRQGACRYD